MSLSKKIEWKIVFTAFMLVILCAAFSFSAFMPLFFLVGFVASTSYLIVGIKFSMRAPNELHMHPLQLVLRLLHALCFYSLVVFLFAGIMFLCVQAVLVPLGILQASRWAMLTVFSLALSIPVVMAAFVRLLLSKTAGWDRLQFTFRVSKNLLELPLAVVAAAIIVGLVLSPIIDTAVIWTQYPLFRWLGLAGMWGGLAFLLARTNFLVRNGTLRKRIASLPLESSRSSKILFVGADGGDWHVIMPLIRAGRMPNLRCLMESGCYGYLDTAGRMHSPVIWTTVATGASVELHGITDFFKHDPQKREKRALFKSYDRQLPAVWNMLNQVGRSVGVINWLLTYPPENISKYMISHMREEPAVSPPECEGLLFEVLTEVRESESDLKFLETTTDQGEIRLVRPPEEALKDLKRIRAVAPRFMREFPTDLTMVYEDATDGIQHVTWQYREPDRFDARAWGNNTENIQQYGHAIDKAWEEFDEVLGVLLSELGPNGIVMVVSDHGFMPREAPSVYIDMNALLHEMGYLEFNDDESVDFSRTLVYWSTREITSAFADLSINLDQDTRLSTRKMGESDVDVQQVVENLLSLKVNGRKSLFSSVTPLVKKDSRSIQVGLSYETMKMQLGRVIEVGGRERELDQFLKVVPDSSGRHDPSGIFVFSGPGIHKGTVVAAGAVHTVLNDLLGHLRGLSKHLLIETIFHLLAQFGIINPYTTNDVTPTLLYLADCPIPEYAAGYVMDRTLSRELKSQRVVKYVKGYLYEWEGADTGNVDDLDERIAERLRALGYID